MKALVLFLCVVSCFGFKAAAQSETTTQGFVITRVTTTDRINASKFPGTTAKGTQVYDLDTKSFWYWDGAQWVEKLSAGKADPTNDAWVNNSANTRVELGSKSDGASRAPGTEVVVKDDGKVGIGLTDPSSLLSIRQPAMSGSSTGVGPIRAENLSTGSYVRLGEYYAPNNTTDGNGAQFIFGTSGSNGNATEWRFRYSGNNSGENRGELAFYGVVDPIIAYLRNGNVGIGTGVSSPAARLHTNGSLRFESLPSSTTTTKLLGISDIGDVSTRSVADLLPKVLAGCSGTDAISQTVAINATTTSTNPSASLYTVTFTLDRQSIIDVSSVISLTSYNASGGNIMSGYAKGYRAVTELYDGSNALLRSSIATMSYTNYNGGPNLPGVWYLNNSFKHRLAAGTYTLRIRGGVSISSGDNEGARGNFGTSTDAVDIIAFPLN